MSTLSHLRFNPIDEYLLKVINKITWVICWILNLMCSKLTIATIELHQLTSGNSIATIEHIWHINLGFLVYKFEKFGRRYTDFGVMEFWCLKLKKVGYWTNWTNIYFFKVKNKSNRKRCKRCSKLTLKSPERHSCCSDFLLLTLNWFFAYWTYFSMKHAVP